MEFQRISYSSTFFLVKHVYLKLKLTMMILVNNKHDFINKKIQRNKLSSIALQSSGFFILVWFGVQSFKPPQFYTKIHHLSSEQFFTSTHSIVLPKIPLLIGISVFYKHVLIISVIPGLSILIASLLLVFTFHVSYRITHTYMLRMPGCRDLLG